MFPFLDRLKSDEQLMKEEQALMVQVVAAEQALPLEKPSDPSIFARHADKAEILIRRGYTPVGDFDWVQSGQS